MGRPCTKKPIEKMCGEGSLRVSRRRIGRYVLSKPMKLIFALPFERVPSLPLAGLVPPELWGLVALQQLSLWGNELTGES